MKPGQTSGFSKILIYVPANVLELSQVSVVNR